MAKQNKYNIADDKIEAYDRLIATCPQIERKGANVPYTSVNGHMFTMLDDQCTLAIRLPKDAVDAFLKKYNSSLHVAYGITRKDYVAVPDELLQKTDELKPYLELSFEHFSKLKPKPTTKKK